ncbi:MAG: TlpA family protein disulfide reductase [Mucilaginibacter sp.]
MKNVFYAISLFCIVTTAYSQGPALGKPVVEPAKILKDGMSLLYYNRDYLKTTEDFIAFDGNSHVISKDRFFRLFATGDYLPLRLSSTTGKNYYRLYKLGPKINDDTRTTLRSFGKIGYDYYKMEGKKFPGLNYTDINGKVYNTENTKGKIVVIKCWFLACQACNEEIPELNRLVASYANRKDIVFISLAFDPKAKLQAFTKKTVFKYALVPVKESYMVKELGVNFYPTHFLLNKQGFIVKVVGEAGELITALNKEAAK